MVEEFDLPMEIIDRKVTKMKMISPSNREVDVGKTLSDKEWIGMCRREVMDDFLRKRCAFSFHALFLTLPGAGEEVGVGGKEGRLLRWRVHCAPCPRRPL